MYLPASSTSRRAGDEKPEMQGLVEHLAAEQVHEDTEAAEEDRQPQVEELEHTGVDKPIFGEIDDQALVVAIEDAVGKAQVVLGGAAVEVLQVAALRSSARPLRRMRSSMVESLIGVPRRARARDSTGRPLRYAGERRREA